LKTLIIILIEMGLIYNTLEVMTEQSIKVSQIWNDMNNYWEVQTIPIERMDNLIA
jgi:hypothetical protein